MKKIVKGNDFTMRIPVMKLVDGEKQAFPLPGCTDIVVRACSAYRRYELTYTVDAKEDNVCWHVSRATRYPWARMPWRCAARYSATTGAATSMSNSR